MYLVILICMEFVTAFTTVILKPSFSQDLSLHSYLYLAEVHLVEFDHSLFGSHWQWYNVGERNMLSQPSWLLGRRVAILTYLLTCRW